MNTCQVFKEITSKLQEEYAKHQVGRSLQEVFTSPELTFEMLKHVDTLNNKSVLVIANLETYLLLRWLKEQNKPNSKWKSLHFLTDNRSLRGKDNIIYCDFNKLHKLNIDMKFDVAILNPPYSRGLHLQFLSLAYDLLKEDGQLVCIHPSDWLVLQRENKTRAKYDLLKSKFGNSVKSIIFLDGNKVFKDSNASFFIPLEIIHINKAKNNSDIIFSYEEKSINKIVRSIYDINLIGDHNMIKSIRDKIIAKSLPTVRDFANKDFNHEEKYYVCANWMAGAGTFESTFNDGKTRVFARVNGLINPINNYIFREPLRSKPMKKGKEGNLKTFFVFNSKSKAQNLLNFFTKSILHKYIMLTYCNNQHVQESYDYTPWLDWSINWKDEDINKFFNFTKEEYLFMVSAVDRFAVSVI